MAGLGPGDKPAVVTKRARKVARKHTSAPAYKPAVTDVQSSGGDYGTKQANRYKKTQASQSDVKAVYRSLPVHQRQQIIKHVNPHSVEGKAILSDHTARIERNAELEKSAATKDIKSNGDIARAAEFKASPEYKQIIDGLSTHHKSLLDKAIGLPGKIIHAVYPEAGTGGKGGHEATAHFAAVPMVANPNNIAPVLLRTTGSTIVQDPTHQIPKLAGDTAKSVLGAPAGIAKLVLDPEGAAKGIAADYSRRYGALVRGEPGAETKLKERQKKEGVAPEVFDLVGAATVGGAGVGRGLQAVARSEEIAKAGKTGAMLHRVATERPKVRLSGNVVKDQEITNNLFRNMAAGVADAARHRRTARKAAKHEAPAHVREAVANGEITFGKRKTSRAVRRDVAKTKSVRLAQQRSEQQREINHGAIKNLASLSANEQSAFKYAMQLGLPADPVKAVTELTVRRAQIAAERKAHPIDIPKRQDELLVIDRLISNADTSFTPKLAEVVKQERERGSRLAANDPGISDTQSAMRRALPQAEHLGVARRGVPVQQALQTSKQALKTAKKARKRAGTKLTRLERQGGVSHGRAQIKVAQASRVTAKEVESAQRAVKLHDRAAANHLRADRETAAKNAIDRRDAAKARLAELVGTIDRKPVGTLRVAERNEGKVLEARKKLEATNAEVKVAKKAVKKAKATKNRGESLVDAEPPSDFIARVKAAAAQQGLDEPGYVPSQKRPEGVFSAFAVGGKERAATPKNYTGSLMRSGRESVDPAVYTTGLAQNIKRKYNWNMVAENFDRHAFTWSKGKTINELKDEMERRGIDPNSVGFWNPKLYRQARQSLEHNTDGNSGEVLHGEDVGNPQLSQAVQDSAIDFRSLAAKPEDFNKRGGWSLVPKDVYDEITHDTKPSGRIGRGFDIAKGKASRFLLANPGWLQFQTASNALLTGITGTGPVNAVKAQVWWHKLSPEERDAIEPYIGVTKFHDDQTKLGSAANGRFVNAYRAFKQTSFYNVAHKANPLDAIFRADNAQNNFFRKSVLYTKVKRDAYASMGANVSRAQNIQFRLAHLLDLGPDDAMKKILADPKVFERHAHYVNDMLGDYMTYTYKERRILSRGVMFYGFMRFSLRFMFYTMPATHPIVASAMVQLGRLHKDELQEIFGADVPPWDIGNYYTSDGKTKIAVGRINPFFNAAQYFDLTTGNVKPNQLTGLAPPFIQTIANQVAGKNVFMGKNWQVNGSTTEARSVGNVDRAQIFVADFLKGLGPANSLATALDPKLRGKQGADSSVLFPQPIAFKRSDAMANNKRLTDQHSRSIGEILRETVAPLAGVDATADIANSRYYTESKKKAKKTKAAPAGLGVASPAVGVNVGGTGVQIGVRP
jgi:hypothetical protein